MIVKLRTLTRKSIIGFGNYVDLRVGDLIDTDRSNELISIYYNLGNISFCDDVLKELKVADEFKIDKPGRNYEMRKLYWDFIIEQNNSTLSLEERMRNGGHRNKLNRNKSKGSLAAHCASDKRYYSKGAMKERRLKK